VTKGLSEDCFVCLVIYSAEGARDVKHVSAASLAELLALPDVATYDGPRRPVYALGGVVAHVGT